MYTEVYGDFCVFDSQLNKALLDATAEEASDTCAGLIEQFCDNEDFFKGKPLDLAVLDLITANKDATGPVIEAVQARGKERMSAEEQEFLAQR